MEQRHQYYEATSVLQEGSHEVHQTKSTRLSKLNRSERIGESGESFFFALVVDFKLHEDQPATVK